MEGKRSGFEPIDHTADAGIKIYGADLADLFSNAALGLFDIITDLEKVHAKIERKVRVESSDIEALLVDWLSELNYLFLTERMLYKVFEIEEMGENTLLARIKGEPLDLDRHEIYTEVKAVTFHKLYIKPVKTGWEAQVIFDL